MAKDPASEIPSNAKLIEPVYEAILELGGSGSNKEIFEKVKQKLKLSPEAEAVSHLGSSTTTELYYRIAWAKTKLKQQKRITNSERSVWSICVSDSDGMESKESETLNIDFGPDEVDEYEKWRDSLSDILHNIDPFAFERLAKRLLRECGFESVEVTKKSGDGGIDGYGKLKVNGIFCFNVAFQCKRYSGSVPASDIRDFRGSLSRAMEKGIFITTGTFSPAAIKEASDSGKQQIDLIDGEELLTKMRDLGLGLKEVKDYAIDRDFFVSLLKEQ